MSKKQQERSTAQRIIQFLKLLEEKLPKGNWQPPVLNAVQRQPFSGGMISRSVTNHREKGWIYSVALTISGPAGIMTLFLTDDDLDKPAPKLVKECLAIVNKHQLQAVQTAAQ